MTVRETTSPTHRNVLMVGSSWCRMSVSTLSTLDILAVDLWYLYSILASLGVMVYVKAGSLTYLKLASQSNLRSGSSLSPIIARERIPLPGQASLNSPHMAVSEEIWEMRPIIWGCKKANFCWRGWRPGIISPESRGAATKPLLWLRPSPSLTLPPLVPRASPLIWAPWE